jgi:large subunit ribosomal protein L13
MNKTKFFTKVDRKWVVVDAKDKILGRLATRIAWILQGKNKATYTPNALCGDKVTVINAKYVKVTGKKLNDKIYDRYTGYPGGIKFIDLKTLMQKNPSRALYLAVKGMVPRGPRGRAILKSLKVYPEGQTEQAAQKPQGVSL